MKGDSQPVEVCLRPLRKIQTPIGSSKVLNHQILLQRLVNSTGTPASSYTLQQTLINTQRQTHTLIRLWKHTFSFHHWDFLWSIQNPLSKKNAITNYHMAQSSIFLHIFSLLLSLIRKKTLVFSLLLLSKNVIHFHAFHMNKSDLVLLRYALMIFI